MQQKIESDEIFLDSMCFSDETLFYLNGTVSKHNCRIWGSPPPQEIIEHQMGKAKVNMWCDMMKDRIIGPFVSFRKQPRQAIRTWTCYNTTQW
jgi:hypothetical protein